MMISGPTACGKTTMVKDLLQHHTSRIQPAIHRIVWLYRRWQPLYTIIERTVVPKVHFIQGIPNDLDDDEFFDPRLNNLLVLDDLFSEAGKDKRITDLFTEGSHHRSLSVITINQNLFGNKDPTQRRNCHYMTLFNNPVDKQSLMTLARQMYPGQTDRFMKIFMKAIKHPYGYLLVDLKPFTPENQRLRCIEPRSQKADTDHVTQETIKGCSVPGVPHSVVGTQTDNIVDYPEQRPIKESLEKIYCNSEAKITKEDLFHSSEYSSDIMENKGQPCDDCGQLFDTVHDVQRHVKRGWCPESNDDPPAKKQKIKYDAMEKDEEVDDNLGYRHLWQLAQNCGREKFNKLYDQYIDNGESEENAVEMTEDRAQLYKEKNFFEKYQSLLEQYWFPLQSNATHRSIIDQISNSHRKGMDLTTAVKRTLKKNRNLFEDLFDIEDSDEEDSDISDVS